MCVLFANKLFCGRTTLNKNARDTAKSSSNIEVLLCLQLLIYFLLLPSMASKTLSPSQL